MYSNKNYRYHDGHNFTEKKYLNQKDAKRKSDLALLQQKFQFNLKKKVPNFHLKKNLIFVSCGKKTGWEDKNMFP